MQNESACHVYLFHLETELEGLGFHRTYEVDDIWVIPVYGGIRAMLLY